MTPFYISFNSTIRDPQRRIQADNQHRDCGERDAKENDPIDFRPHTIRVEYRLTYHINQ